MLTLEIWNYKHSSTDIHRSKIKEMCSLPRDLAVHGQDNRIGDLEVLQQANIDVHERLVQIDTSFKYLLASDLRIRRN